MPKKILYIMHLDWRWIKQRPHFIAEGLSDFYDVTVIHFYSKHYLFKNSETSTPNEKNLKLLPAFRLPFYQKKIIYDLNKIYIKLYFKFLIERYDPDFLWITFPQLYDYIPSNHHCKIIYDCMDLSTGFDYKENFKLRLSNAESRLINDSDAVFVSSNNLLNKLDETYHCSDKLVLVRNAFGGKIINDLIVEKKHEKSLKIGYVGSIHSQLIDFGTVKRTLEESDNIEYHFIGPLNYNVKFEHDKVKFYGIITHKDLYSYVKNFDCLILPFKLDELVKFVDPVKLYEYINYNKPIISVYYEELEYFSQFLYFYSDSKDLVAILNQMIEEGLLRKYSDSERLEFLKNNSWDVRIHKIVKSLEEL
jgi:teichuronic acid biosynthesis glycosyltransferase TuaH